MSNTIEAVKHKMFFDSDPTLEFVEGFRNLTSNICNKFGDPIAHGHRKLHKGSLLIDSYYDRNHRIPDRNITSLFEIEENGDYEPFVLAYFSVPFYFSQEDPIVEKPLGKIIEVAWSDNTPQQIQTELKKRIVPKVYAYLPKDVIDLRTTHLNSIKANINHILRKKSDSPIQSVLQAQTEPLTYSVILQSAGPALSSSLIETLSNMGRSLGMGIPSDTTSTAVV